MNVWGRVDSVTKTFCCPPGKGYVAGVLPCGKTYKNSPKYYEGTAQLFKKFNNFCVAFINSADTKPRQFSTDLKLDDFLGSILDWTGLDPLD